jgi:hypothetical protein
MMLLASVRCRGSPACCQRQRACMPLSVSCSELDLAVWLAALRVVINYKAESVLVAGPAIRDGCYTLAVTLWELPNYNHQLHFAYAH